MPEAAPARGVESLGDGGGGGGVLPQQEIAHVGVGDIGVMQEVDLSPVFYGEALMGRDLPHLTYMLCSPDMETHKRNWEGFLAHPTWVRLKNDPQYADTVSHITSRFLEPAAYSQI